MGLLSYKEKIMIKLIGKKVGLFAIYYILASLIDQLFNLFTGDILISLIGTVIAMSVISFNFKKIYIVKQNHVQEERDEINASLSSLAHHILNLKPYWAECALGVLFCLLSMAVPSIAVGISYGFLIFLSASNIYMLLLSVIFVLLDFFLWFLAYKSCFKVKKY